MISWFHDHFLDHHEPPKARRAAVLEAITRLIDNTS